MDLPYFLLLLFLLHDTSAFNFSIHRDKVISLPGAPTLPEFNLFSGYLNGSSNGAAAPIFYVLAESIRVDPSTAPLVIWFNGGPGGSSLKAFFEEHGPYRLAEKGDVLTYHEFSWNQYANVLYLESPLGVGFSQNSNGDTTMNDLDAAEINFHALKDFMIRVHPNYSDREYYLSGQSYAGAFIPYFARRLLVGIESEEMKNGNFKGFSIGNPVFRNETEILAQNMQYMSYALIPLEIMRTEEVSDMWTKLEEGGVFTEEDLADIEMSDFETAYSFKRNSPIDFNFIEHCYKQPEDRQKYHSPTGKQSISCYIGDALTTYLNRLDVQSAFHVGDTSVGTKNWTAINLKIVYNFTRDFNVLHVYDDIFSLVNGSSFRVLIYNGDTDMMISPLHTIHSVEKIAEANSLEDQGYPRAWRFYGDFAGIRTSYIRGNVTMDVLTVRGAGHSVPTDLPAQAFQMINNFLFTEENEEIDYSEPIRKHGKL